jgi:glucosaminylphosphatidylinositol acyltransferase
MAAISSSSSRIQRGYNQISPQLSQTNPSQTATKQIQKMIPLLIMGTIRLITHKGIDYPEHNSEYGVHWNFFYTLAFIIPTTSFIKSYIYKNKKPNWLIPIFIFITYQYILSYHNLQDFIINTPRRCPTASTSALSYLAFFACDLWYANREGIVGCISYTALYLLSDYIAYSYFWDHKKRIRRMESSTTNNNNILIWETTKPLWLSVLALFGSWQLLVSLSFLPLEVSRRSTNAIFCIWVLFVNLFQLASIYTIVLLCSKIVVKPSNIVSPILLSSMNRNGLYIFIIANLFTGIVNLSVDTLSASNHVAICILLLYVGTVALVSILLNRVRVVINERKGSISKESTKED